MRNWTKNSWKKYPIEQQPEWPEQDHFNHIISKLSKLPSLVFSGETRSFKKQLVNVNKNKAFILQVGACSESFNDCHGPKIHNFLRIMLQMAMILAYKSNKEIIKVGRIAGQYSKPRTQDFEIIHGEKLPSYRGDAINDYTPSKSNRNPNPDRLLEAYFRSAATLNLIRAFIQGGYNDIKNLTDWKEHFFSKEISNLDDYKDMEKDLTTSLQNGQKELKKSFNNNQVFISHEALLLDYEEVFTRIDTTVGGWYATSAHSLWIGNRTRQKDGAHVEYVSGIGNPIGIKIGPDYDVYEMKSIIHKINPQNEIGKIMLVIRMGHEKIQSKFPSLVRALQYEDMNVIWICDPMHGNTFQYNGYKVRHFDDIVSEIKSFFSICKTENIIPGGIHLEITEEYVSECTGGLQGLSLSNIEENYCTTVDPRLNAAQALEIAFIVGQCLQDFNSF